MGRDTSSAFAETAKTIRTAIGSTGNTSRFILVVLILAAMGFGGWWVFVGRTGNAANGPVDTRPADAINAGQATPSAVLPSFVFLAPSSGATVQRCGNEFRVLGSAPVGKELVLAVQRVGGDRISFKSGFRRDALNADVVYMDMTVGSVAETDEDFAVSLYLVPSDTVNAWEANGVFRRHVAIAPPLDAVEASSQRLQLHRSTEPANCTE